MNSDILLSCEAPGAGVSTQNASLDKQTLEHQPSEILTKIITHEENLLMPIEVTGAEVAGRLAAANPDLGFVEDKEDGAHVAGQRPAEITDPDLVNQHEQPEPHILEKEDYAMKLLPKAQSQQPSPRAQKVELERVTSRQVASKQKILDVTEVRKSRKGKKSLAVYGFKPGHAELSKKKITSQLPLL